MKTKTAAAPATTAVVTAKQYTSLMQSNSIDEVLQAFAMAQRVNENTRRLYVRELRQFFQWVQTTGRSTSQLHRIDIIAYCDWLESRINATDSSRISVLSACSYLTAVRRFYIWADSEGLARNIAQNIKAPKKDDSFRKMHLTLQQSVDFMEYTSQLSVRDRALLALLIMQGLRTVEISRLCMEDITYSCGVRVLKLWRKGRKAKDKEMRLCEECHSILREYIDSERVGADATAPLFVSTSNNSKGQPLSTRTISAVAKQALQAFGLDDKMYTAHSLRHTFATNMLQLNVPLTELQYNMGHTDPKTTQIYLKSIETEYNLTAGVVASATAQLYGHKS